MQPRAEKLASCRHIVETLATRCRLRRLHVKGRRTLQLFQNLTGKYHVSHVENVRPYWSFDICPYTLFRPCSCSAILCCYNWSHCETAMPCYPYPFFSFICNLFICLYPVRNLPLCDLCSSPDDNTHICATILSPEFAGSLLVNHDLGK